MSKECCWIVESVSNEKAYRPCNFSKHLELGIWHSDKEAFIEDRVDVRVAIDTTLQLRNLMRLDCSR